MNVPAVNSTEFSSKECIVRRLADGWDYRPDWRSQLIDANLVSLAGAPDRTALLQDMMFDEPDPFVRQGLRFRFSGRCVNQPAIEQAFRISAENGRNGVGSRIKALVIADRFPEEICELLHVPVSTVVAFERLHWDVRRYLGATLWLDGLVRSAENSKGCDQAASCEAVWLRTALDEGWPGLERLWLRKRGTDAKSLDQLTREIEGIAARRALRHLQQLEETGAPVSDDDIKRLVVVSRRAAASSTQPGDERNFADFYQRLLDSGTQNVLQHAPESSKAKALELGMAERLGLPSISGKPVRRRMRLNLGE